MNSSLICEGQSCVQIMYTQINTHTQSDGEWGGRKRWESGKWQVDKHQGELLQMVTEMETKQILISFSAPVTFSPRLASVSLYLYLQLCVSVYLAACISFVSCVLCPVSWHPCILALSAQFICRTVHSQLPVTTPRCSPMFKLFLFIYLIFIFVLRSAFSILVCVFVFVFGFVFLFRGNPALFCLRCGAI